MAIGTVKCIMAKRGIGCIPPPSLSRNIINEVAYSIQLFFGNGLDSYKRKGMQEGLVI